MRLRATRLCMPAHALHALASHAPTHAHEEHKKRLASKTKNTSRAMCHVSGGLPVSMPVSESHRNFFKQCLPVCRRLPVCMYVCESHKNIIKKILFACVYTCVRNCLYLCLFVSLINKISTVFLWTYDSYDNLFLVFL